MLRSLVGSEMCIRDSMREDIEIGLALMVSIAKWANVLTPVAEGLLNLGSSVCEINFSEKGRSLKNLNIENYSISQLKEILDNGFK